MASFIYFYSKFTEEFLLLSAAGVFTLLSIYCYHWVIKKRRLGAARNMVPAGMVKVYLNQLINEAQFVRTQLFGLLGGEGGNPADFQKMFLNNSSTSAPTSTPFIPSGDVPKDLVERLQALEGQLAQKEGMVVNVNIEKSKLLEEIENLKQNQSMIGGQGAGGDNSDLLKKIKTLEERLEEYALFEDDLANLKRLQQENTQLKKRVDEMANRAPSASTTPEPEPIRASSVDDKKPVAALDQDAIDALLNGETPVPSTEKPKTTTSKKEPAVETLLANPVNQAAIDALVENVKAPAVEPTADSFEKLVDSVETSLEKSVAPAAVAPTLAPTPAQEPVAAEAIAASAAEIPTIDNPPAVDADLAAKTDEELLKEFENLLNS